MKSIFTDFWKVNLGHVAIAAVFIFGLGVTWTQANGRVEMVDIRESNRHETVLRAIETDVKERDIYLAAVRVRLDAVESWQKDASTILKAIEALTNEQRHTNESLKDIRIDLKDVQRRIQAKE